MDHRINPKFSQLLKNPVHFLAFGFGSGLAPKGPGTAGTVVALVLWTLLATLPLYTYIGVVVAVSLLGFYLCGKTARDMGVHDHPGIVWDEIAGYWLTMTALPATWSWALAGFVLFRLFDIWKPWPISWLDRQVHGGVGIMVDDLLAGLFAWVILFSASQWMI
ncbi:phosphatidylglycerophosphatase A [Porticoccus litoralis]|uniref:Phosphatidylglycerophosphatase A n=1 Tax=Porticoccus litoralis TaxID=434086 RepID=A0AAW8B3H8_9GAMM|nr:phosphatidylglycerophosphatase A [Porticoccus litoralis]MDP1520099.1 phosphatidylglycerophosphatase A [Porticoccus litoralis]